MNRLLAVFLLLLLPAFGFTQTNVDKLARALDSLGSFSYTGWKMSPDLKSLRGLGEAPTQPGFDDSKWETLNLNESIYPDSCWLRKEITLPDNFLGQPVRGNVRFLVSVDDNGYLWVNGANKGYFPWDGEIVLTENAAPGQKFLIVIKAINTGGPLRLLRAELESDAWSPIRKLTKNLALSFRVGQKLLGFDTYQSNAHTRTDPKIDKSTMDRSEKKRLGDLLQSLAARVNVQALGSGDIETFQSSVAAVKADLRPISDFAKRFTLYFDANAHIDAAWLWREAETKEVCKNTFASVFNLMEARPEFTYTQSAAAYYDWMEKLYPDIFAKIQQRVKEGRWEVVGGMWVEPDCNLPGGESWMRHLLYSKKYFQKKLGVDVKIGWNPDSFGYNENMPMFYRQAGIDAFVTQKMGWSEKNVFPHRVFWWESPDGSRVLNFFPNDYVNTVEDPFRMIDWLRQFEANSGFTTLLILFGVGDHGGGPSLEMMERIDNLAALDIYPNIKYGNTTQYLDWLRSQDLSALPVWKDEIYLEYHQGCYTTQAAIKAENRKSEVLLTDAEKFATIATMYGKQYDTPSMEQAWRSVLFNQFHDILPGSGIREIYIDAKEKYELVRERGSFELQKSLQHITQQVNTASIGKGTPLFVFNTLAWDRSDVAAVELPPGDTRDYAVYDASGKEVPSQIDSVAPLRRNILFIARGIPSMGYKLFSLRSGPKRLNPAAAASTLQATDKTLENEFFRVEVDRETGWVKGMFDKKHAREILAGPGNELQLLEDKPRAWDAWNVGLTGVQYPSTFRRVEVIERGPVRAILRMTRDYLKPGVKKDFPTEDFPSTFFTQDVILYDGIDRIDFQTNVDWWEEKTMLKVSFPLAVTDTIATYEIPFGSIERSTQLRDSWDSAKVEVSAQKWVDLSGQDYGVSLLNRSKYGFDIKGNIMRMSLLRSPKWPDPTADRGKHAIQYALYPHAGRVAASQTHRRGYEYNTPLVAVTGEQHAGKLPLQKSFVQLSPADMILTTIKKAEEDESWVVQWFNRGDEDAEAALTLPKSPRKVVRSNVMEEDVAPMQSHGSTIRTMTKHRSVQTIKVYF